MKKIFVGFLCLLAISCSAFAQGNNRVIVTTDIGGTDPDDEESMVHLLMMANDIDIEGLVCQMAFCKSPIGIGTLNKIIDAYAIAEPNLKAHDERFPTADYLHSIATTGQTEVGMSGVGEGKDTPGSELIMKAIDRDDPRPIWLTAWGGMNTIAQAIWKAQHTRCEADFKKFIGKIRIYDILGQCDAGAWIAHNFPDILYIRARDVYNWAPDDNWTKQNIQAFPPMGSVYPTRKWATEGDSPSFLYLVNNGLNMPEEVRAGGWGGRFNAEKTEAVRGMDWVERNNLDEKQYDPYLMHTNPNGEKTMQQWSNAIRNDFAARIQWSVNADYSAANHHPIVLINEETEPTRLPIYIETKAGEEITFSTKNSSDPDGNALSIKAYLYKEASDYNRNLTIKNDNGVFSFTIPTDATGKTLHIIIEATDNGKPALTTYRRLMVKVQTPQKPRVIVLTDSETDDRCSMAHLLFCSNDVEIAALIQTNSCFQRHGWSSEHWLEKQIDHYAEVYPNLKVHSEDYPSPDYLRSRIYVGDEDPAHVCLDTPASATQIGAPSRINPHEWAATPGSEAIVKILLDNDPRPVFIQAWGGGNTAAKALQVIKDKHPADYERAARKVVMYNIWYQDAAGNYIEQEHPLVTMLVSYHFHATWDYGAQNHTADFVKRWLHDSPSALARDYVQTNISEGDSPAFLYSLSNGLRSHEHPTYGGWGGQFYKVAGMANVYRDTDKGSYSRWTEYVLRDFQSRLVWAVTPRYEDANHAPAVTIREGLDKTVRSGERVTLTADVEDDGFLDLELQWQHRQYISEQKGVDKAKFFENTRKRPQKFETAWWQFYEAGTCHEHVDLQINPDNPNQVSFLAPVVTKAQTLHLIFQTTDNNKMGLTGFARVILTVLPK